MDIIEKIKTGDDKAFEVFFTNFYPSLYLFANRYLNDESVSADIVQEAFILFWKKSNIFSTPLGAKTYLYKYVRSKCIDYLTEIKKQNSYKESIQNTEVYFRDLLIEEETFQFIRKLISQLTESEKEIIEFSMDGLKNQEIADRLSLSINSIKTLKKRAYKKMRERIRNNRMLVFLILSLQRKYAQKNSLNRAELAHRSQM